MALSQVAALRLWVVEGTRRRLALTLSWSEMLALSAGEKLLSGLAGTLFHESAISALDKVRAALPRELVTRAQAGHALSADVGSRRDLASQQPGAPAETLLGRGGVKVLRVVLREWRRDFRLSAAPTVREAMLAIAGIGGHIPNNGEPGWQVLGRGFIRYAEAEALLRAATCDQS